MQKLGHWATGLAERRPRGDPGAREAGPAGIGRRDYEDTPANTGDGEVSVSERATHSEDVRGRTRLLTAQ
jgi:hypothetical protein